MKCGFYTDAGEVCTFRGSTASEMLSHIASEHGHQEASDFLVSVKGGETCLSALNATRK